jgi:hypothetical protein
LHARGLLLKLFDTDPEIAVNEELKEVDSG